MRLIVVCAAALGGVAVGDVGRLEPGWLVLGGLLAAVGTALARRRPACRVLGLVACAAALGGLRASLAPLDDPAEAAAALAPYLGLTVRLYGVVVQPPSFGPATVQLLVDARGVAPAGRDPPPVAGRPSRVRVVGDPATLPEIATGDMLALEGRLLPSDRPGPPTLLFPRLLRQQPDPTVEPVARLGSLRSAAQAGIARYLPEPQASLSGGVLLGGAGRLDADFRLQLQRSGLAHVVAIDGFKQVIVAAGLAAVAGRLLGARAAALPVVLGIAGYTLLTGAHPAAVRAGLMVGLATLAALTGRVADPLTSVLVAATVMAALDPRILLDVGLQLSLSATLGIVLLWPRLRPWLKGLPRVVAEPAGLTVAVTLATLPVVLSAFQMVSLVSPLAHVVAVPLLPPVLLSSALLAVVSPLPAVAGVVAWAAWLPSTLLVAIIEIGGSLPGAALSTGRPPAPAAAALAAALLLWGISGLPEAAPVRQLLTEAWTNLGIGRAAPRGLGCAPALGNPWTPAACLATCLIATTLLQVVRPDGRMHVWRFAQSRGEAIFIRGPTGRTVLLVGGRLEDTLLVAQVADHLAVWEHRLDTVLLLDADAQAKIGPTLARYPATQQLEAAAADARLDLGGGAALDVYAGDGQPLPAVSVSFGRVWLPLAGQPPAPPDSPQLAKPPEDADQVSDGIDVWTTAAAEVRSAPTTSAATPGSGD